MAQENIWRVGSYVIKNKGEHRLWVCNGRQRLLRELTARGEAFALFEAPHRVAATAVELAGILGAGRRVVVARADGTAAELATRHVLIATGAESWLPPGFALDGTRVVTSREALSLPAQPGRMAVLGGGVIGCEFAGFFAALGTKVTLIEMLPRLVAPEDDEISQALERELRKRGIEVLTGTRVEDRRDGPDGAVVLTLAGGRTVEVDTVLVAVGRRPHTAGLE